MNLVTVQ